MAPKCGQRATYYKHHSGLCVLPPHTDEVEHLVEMITPDYKGFDYTKGRRAMTAVEPLPGETRALHEHQESALQKLRNGSVLAGGSDRARPLLRWPITLEPCVRAI